MAQKLHGVSLRPVFEIRMGAAMRTFHWLSLMVAGGLILAGAPAYAQVSAPVPVPEPTTLTLLAVGLGGLALARRRNRRK